HNCVFGKNTHLEVGGVHTQLVSVQFADNSSHDGLSMLLHWGRSRAQVSPVGKVSLGLGVDDQHSKGAMLHTHPQHFTISHGW
uniref:Uncharacterized protein n=1 Tax=Astyanax mexicanus TaxID=7994 RepID=A0A3B1KHI3_ASTMX